MLFKDEDETEEDIDEKRFLDAEMTKGKLSEWIKEDQTIKFIRSRFSKFLKSFQGEANYPIYSVAIREMCTSNKQSLEVSYEHLKNTNPTLAIWIAFEPLVIFPYLNLTAYHIACKNYPAY
jgi:DNA replication licensing factor MCM2